MGLNSSRTLLVEGESDSRYDTIVEVFNFFLGNKHF